ncbi:MAG TPA: hypothetical protein VGG89_02350 [Candidatus Baltobacteraceae bacterium]|jgi:hypothetical protein
MRKSHFPFGRISLAFAFALASCNGTGTSVPATPGGSTSGGSLEFAPAIGPLAPIDTSPGKVDGVPDKFTPPEGDTATGGHGSPIDKIPCLPAMGNGYHVHVFVGIVNHGQLVALPTAIGMVHPGAPVNGYVNTAQCFYEIHTHDSSGIVHLEVAQPHPLTSVVFKLKNVLDVWGVPHDKRSFGPFKGKIRVYVGMPAALGQTNVTQYHPFAGEQWTNMGLRSHEVIWVEIGKPYYNAHQLPPVTFYMEY